MRTPAAHESRHARASIGSMLLCVAGGIAVLIAVMTWVTACREGTHTSCPNGSASISLVFQAILAAAGFATSFAVRHFVTHRAYVPARIALAVTFLLLAAWLVLVDALTNGLQVPFLLLTLAVVVTPFALIAASVKAAAQQRRR